MSRIRVTPGELLPKYTSAQVIAAMMTIQTVGELDKFYTTIRDNQHLSRQYRLQVKQQYLRRRPLLKESEEISAHETTTPPSV